jgi:hypothetical protein
MASSGSLITALSLILGRAPILVLWLVTAGLAVSRWDRHPLASLWASVGAALGLLATFAGALFPLFIRTILGPGAMLRVTLLSTFTSACAMGCLVVAIFIDRPAK